MKSEEKSPFSLSELSLREHQCTEEKSISDCSSVNHSTAGNPLFWENFLLPECLPDSTV